MYWISYYNMRMDSHFDKPPRRVPQQKRAALRVEQIFAAAALEIGEHGFEAMTMTGIAARAGMSIGALYQYFPNKEAIGSAMRTAYGNEMASQWSALSDSADGLSAAELTDRLVDMIAGFIRDYPPYFALAAASVPSTRNADDRAQLRRRFADIFVRQGSLPPAEARLTANVTLEIVKSLALPYGSATPRERKLLAREYKIVISAYLSKKLN